jgi:hypothetical protein
MAGAPVPRIVILGVSPVDPAQQHRKRVFPLGHRYQMDVVGHQTPGKQPDSGILEVLAYQGHVSLAVAGRKRLPPVDSALRHVASDTRQDTTVAPRHIPDSAADGSEALRKSAQFRLTRFLD